MIGLLNINKPAGMTSRRAVDLVARAAGTRRVGHAGTLDPLATGVLVVCLGTATRLAALVQEQRKVYRAEFLLGCRSDTDDVTGQVEPLAGAQSVERGVIESLLPRFTGRIAQVPPAYSAVHVGGRRAYALARRGEEVELAARPVDIYRLEMTAFEFPRLELSVECGSGTYIRALGRDLGEALGTGAVMSRLVRESIGPFRLAGAVDPEALNSGNLAQWLLPPLAAVSHLPRHICSSEDLHELARGRPIACAAEALPPPGSSVALIAPEGTLAAIGERAADACALQPRQVFIATAA